MTEVTPVLGDIGLTSRDMEASLAFYRRLGIEILEDAVWRSSGVAHHVTVHLPNGLTFEIDSEAMTRSFFPRWQGRIPRGPRRVLTQHGPLGQLLKTD